MTLTEGHPQHSPSASRSQNRGERRKPPRPNMSPIGLKPAAAAAAPKAAKNLPNDNEAAQTAPCMRQA